MIRIVRLLPLVLPVVRRVLRNPKVRARLGLKPLPPEQRRRRR